MDIFEARDYNFFVPRRARKLIAFALMIGLTFIPPVQRWYMNQIEQHAEHITRRILEGLASRFHVAEVEYGA